MESLEKKEMESLERKEMESQDLIYKNKCVKKKKKKKIKLDIHASTFERPPHLFCFKPHSANINQW